MRMSLTDSDNLNSRSPVGEVVWGHSVVLLGEKHRLEWALSVHNLEPLLPVH